MESAIAERTDLTATINRLNSAVGNQAQPGQSTEQRAPDRANRVALETEVADNSLYKIPSSHPPLLPTATPRRPTKAEQFGAMWNQYSQGLQESDMQALDYQVAKRAFLDGHSRKEIALMLLAGSPFVREMALSESDERSPHPNSSNVREYVSRVVKAVSQDIPASSLRQKRNPQIELS